MTPVYTTSSQLTEETHELLTKNSHKMSDFKSAVGGTLKIPALSLLGSDAGASSLLKVTNYTWQTSAVVGCDETTETLRSEPRSIGVSFVYHSGRLTGSTVLYRDRRVSRELDFCPADVISEMHTSSYSEAPMGH